jgi:hypothetical protein
MGVHSVMVSISPSRKYLMIGTTELTYTIEDVLNDEIVQSGDTVALPPGGHLKSVFFSEEGVSIVEDGGVLILGSGDI